MKRTIAIPAHLQKDILTEAEMIELQSYGDIALTPAEIEEIENDALNFEAENAKRLVQEEIQAKKIALSDAEALYFKAFRKGDVSEIDRLTALCDDLESEIERLELSIKEKE